MNPRRDGGRHTLCGGGAASLLIGVLLFAAGAAEARAQGEAIGGNGTSQWNDDYLRRLRDGFERAELAEYRITFSPAFVSTKTPVDVPVEKAVPFSTPAHSSIDQFTFKAPGGNLSLRAGDWAFDFAFRARGIEREQTQFGPQFIGWDPVRGSSWGPDLRPMWAVVTTRTSGGNPVFGIPPDTVVDVQSGGRIESDRLESISGPSFSLECSASFLSSHVRPAVGLTFAGQERHYKATSMSVNTSTWPYRTDVFTVAAYNEKLLGGPDLGIWFPFEIAWHSSVTFATRISYYFRRVRSSGNGVLVGDYSTSAISGSNLPLTVLAGYAPVSDKKGLRGVLLYSLGASWTFHVGRWVGWEPLDLDFSFEATKWDEGIRQQASGAIQFTWGF